MEGRRGVGGGAEGVNILVDDIIINATFSKAQFMKFTGQQISND